MIPSAHPEALAKCIENLCGTGGPSTGELARLRYCAGYRRIARSVASRPPSVRYNIAAIVHCAHGESGRAIGRLERSLAIEFGQYDFQALLAALLIEAGLWGTYAHRGELGLDIVAAMKGVADPPQRYDVAHVGKLFDRLSGEYEARVLKEGYAEHTQVARMILASSSGASASRVLDLGCGTGLLGQALRNAGNQASLIGVDASERMLERARERGIYEELHCDDIERFLDLHSGARSIDVAGLASVIPFFGDLRRLMGLIARHSQSPMRVVFTYDVAQGQGVQFNRHGRFRHSPSHVRGALESAGLAIRATQSFVARFEGGEPVPSEVVEAVAARG